MGPGNAMLQCLAAAQKGITALRKGCDAGRVQIEVPECWRVLILVSYFSLSFIWVGQLMYIDKCTLISIFDIRIAEFAKVRNPRLLVIVVNHE